MIPRVPVKSSNVVSVGYQDGTLAIEFRTGVYNYLDVPAETYSKLMASESIGKFVSSEIKGHYRSEKQATAG